MAQEKTLNIGNRTIELSNPEKKMYPKENLTKTDIVNYYEKVSEYMLPHIKNRPLVMHRFPDGIDGDEFYQKEVPDYFPKWIKRKTIDLVKGGSEPLMIAEKKADLVYLAGQACLVPHIWLSTADKPKSPNKIVFDLDPPKGDFKKVKFAAFKLKKMFEAKKFTPYVMTTGSKGLHVIIPIKQNHRFKKVREYVKDVVNELADKYKDKLTTETRKNKRKGRVFLDYLRNAYGQTSVAPYALRAIKGAPVATPLDWDELKKSDIGPQSYNINNIFRRLSRKKDPFKGMMRHAKELDV
jgi:bifunctional non-homologous end joining protein LigD